MVAKFKKSYTIGEQLLKPCMMDICTVLFGNEHVAKIKNIPMSNDKISNRIKITADNIEVKLIDKNFKNPFLFFYETQLDKPTNF